MNKDELIESFENHIKKKISVYCVEFEPEEKEEKAQEFTAIITQTLLNVTLEFAVFSGVPFNLFAQCLMAMLDQPHYAKVEKITAERIELIKLRLMKQLFKQKDNENE